MSTKAKEPSEGDVIVARALSSYAQLRANIASWSSLPSTVATAIGEPDDEDEESFTAESETAGVGYVAPQDGERIKTSTDKLRKQMLGKRMRGGHAGLERKSGQKKTTAPHKGGLRSVKDDQDSEDDEGRSAVGKKRKHINKPASTPETKANPNATNGADSDGGSVAWKPPSSYLDELLAKRSKKRKKKQSKDPDNVMWSQ